MKMKNFSEKRISLEEIKKCNKLNTYINYDSANWKSLWTQKIDYLEYQLEELKYKFPFIYIISDYYIGFVEMGINLMNTNYIKNKKIVHKRIYTTMEINELYNPFNILIDDENRDYAEYFKELIYKGKSIDIYNYINQNKILNLRTFFIRLLYITPYFDMVNNIFNDKLNVKEIRKIVLYNNFYENELSKLYSMLKKNNDIIDIDFFSKKNI